MDLAAQVSFIPATLCCLLCLPPLLFVPSAWTDLGWVGWVCLLMKATEDRWCRLFVVGLGPELQRDPWQEKSRLSVIISANQVEHYPCFSIKTSPQSPDIAVWINSCPASIKKKKVLPLHLSFEVKQHWKWANKYPKQVCRPMLHELRRERGEAVMWVGWASNSFVDVS